MKNKLIILGMLMFILASCSKKLEKLMSGITGNGNTETTINNYVKYTISKGQQYCDNRSLVSINDSLLNFYVKFDSSAIYTTSNKGNQGDINKLFGFSDNNADHHQYSARFGWRWSGQALRLFAYIYNKGVMSFKEIGTVQIGSENRCSLKVAGDKYLFSLNNKEIVMPRESTTTAAQGYKLWPYFGGDELAPHAISIWIKEVR